ncbi:cytochrome c oxidase accessory protein CcoG [Helicobacter enhydrae]|uniref:Cytochrome c oxidase accessory protein CcoG n=1 Tax=Helicobacter enhydrae TaxID=222136 RepID=A0A1B1U7K7_9HELI|nr:cytochrome c oxidase accessory protein CcoG [Helicobacter enhydrae]ANV98720.1 cytochrome c oxidase accessory protein CcoG [Helicobacter enhydrae]
MSYRIKRYWVYSIIAFCVILMPFVHINGNQIFLLSFDHQELHLLGKVFSVQQLQVLPFLVILLFVGIFFATTLLGRVWCGWACPQTIFRVIYRDLLQSKLLGLRKINNKQKSESLETLNQKLKNLFAIFLITLCTFSASAVLLFYFVPPSDFFAYLKNPQEHLVLLGFWLGIGLFFTIDIVLIQENFCTYVCPYCRVQSVLFDDDTQNVIYNQNRGGAIYDTNLHKIPTPLKSRESQAECIECQKCVKVCPTHIDIRAGMQLECINCLECADACSSVMAKFNKTSLITWTSQNAIVSDSKVRYLRPKIIGYVFVLALAIGLAIFMGGRGSSLILNITHATSLYTHQSNGIITNEYIVLAQNESKEADDFKLEIIKSPDISILKPTQTISIQGDHQKRFVLVLAHQQTSTATTQAQTRNIPITIRLTSTKNPEVFVEKKTFFVYPIETQNKGKQ